MVVYNIASYSLLYLGKGVEVLNVSIFRLLTSLILQAIWMVGTYWDSSGRAAVIPKDPIS